MDLNLDLWAFWPVLKILAFFLVLTILVETIRSLPRWIRDARARRAGLDKVDQMTGRDFEVWLESLFRRGGYRVRRTRDADDGGADLILTRADGTKIAVQAKKLKNGRSRAGVDAVSEVLRGKKVYGCDEAWVITNQGYTRQAREQAPKCGVKLLDRDDLIRFVEQVQQRQQ